jgi:hypothetical protein
VATTIKRKVGDTLQCTGTYKDENGNPVNLTNAGIGVESSLLSPDGEKRVALTVVVNPDQVTNPGKYTVTGDLTDLEPGKGWRWDIRYTDATDFSFSSDTILIDLSERIS